MGTSSPKMRKKRRRIRAKRIATSEVEPQGVENVVNA